MCDWIKEADPYRHQRALDEATDRPTRERLTKLIGTTRARLFQANSMRSMPTMRRAPCRPLLADARSAPRPSRPPVPPRNRAMSETLAERIF
jgi:hypothetical protein